MIFTGCMAKRFTANDARCACTDARGCFALLLQAVPKEVLNPADTPIILVLHDQLHSSRPDTCRAPALPVAANVSPSLGMKSACTVCH